jgi:hypothetical protein
MTLININSYSIVLFCLLALARSSAVDDGPDPPSPDSSAKAPLAVGAAATGSFGIELQEDGRTYHGQLIRGKREGHGVFRFPDGSIYRGQWKQGNREGHGVHHTRDGEAYIGQWRQDVKEGHGVYRWRDGTTFSGHWKNGLRDGPGVLWKRGKIEGQGMHQAPLASLLSAGQRILQQYQDGKPVSSVPFDGANAEHAIVLRKASEAKACGARSFACSPSAWWR